MNALGSSSKWPSYDSLTSTSSLLFSESEQTEDEADIFSEGEGETGMRKSLSRDERIKISGNYLDFPTRADQIYSRSRNDQPEEIKHPNPASSPGGDTLGSSSATPGDLAFAQKCADLQRFICPLHELLHGLKAGRFEKGLSSFQQSVAIDRLQRILGILQRPEMGEKHLQNLLQIEIMLKIWFPRVAFQATSLPSLTSVPLMRPHWRQNQLHMPVKKRKLSWCDQDDSRNVLTKVKHCERGSPLKTLSTRLTGSPKIQRSSMEATVEPATGHEFTYSTCFLSRPFYFCSRRANVNHKRRCEILLPSPCKSPATQDSSVSSSVILTTTDSP